MNGITHKQAIKWIHRRMDGMLKGNEASQLDEHLASCESCRTFANEMGTLPVLLNEEFKDRWDINSGPSSQMAAQISAKARKFPIQRRFSSSMKLATGIAAIAVLAFAMNFIISQLQSASITTTNIDNDTPSAHQGEPVGLLAFTFKQNGNLEIYTIQPDGSGQTNITNDPANDSYPFWSPDGRHIAFESDRAGSSQIYLMDADGSNVQQLTEGEGDYSLDANGFSPWSPDGSKLIVSNMPSGGKTFDLHILDIATKITTPLTAEPGEYILSSWSSDGTHIAFIASQTGRFAADLFVVGSDGSHLVKVTETLPSDEYFSRNYDWSPDGNYIIFATHGNELGYQDPFITGIYEANVDGSLTNLTRSADTYMIDRWNGVNVRLQTSSEKTLSWIRPDGSQSSLNLCQNDGQITGITFKRSHTGDLVFGSDCSPDGWDLYWSNPEGTATTPILNSSIPSNQDSVFHLTWSFDDRYLSFVSVDSYSADLTETLYILDIAKARQDPSTTPLILPNSFGQDWQPITNHEIVNEKPTPEPTGYLSSRSLIAYTSDESGNTDIYTMRADGSEVRNITTNSAIDYSPAWSPDGQKIIFVSERTGNPEIFSMDPDGSHLIQMTDNPGYDGFFSLSPNGERIIYLSSVDNDSNTASLVIMNVDGSNKLLLTKPGSYIFLGWSPNGQKIVYQKQILETAGPQDNEIHVSDIDGGNHYQWTAIIDEIKWEDEQHFLGYGWSGQSEPPAWDLYRFSSNGVPPLEIASHNSRIVALYEHTYVAEGASMLDWYGMDGNSTPLHSWDVEGDCKQRGDQYIQETSQTTSPDGKRVFITVYCNEGYLQFYFANAEGSELKQITDLSIETPINNRGVWSLDGRLVIMSITNQDGITTDLYLFDVEAMLRDPSTQPIQLTADGAAKYDIVWQPIRKSEVNEEKTTPEPTPVNASEELPDINTNVSNGEWIAFLGTKMADSVDIHNQPMSSDLYVIHPDGSGLTNLTQFPAYYYNLQWSPNGQHLLFLRENTDLDQTDIMRHYAGSTSNGTIIRPITDPDHYGYGWSPNSNKIVFADSSNGNYDIYTVYADGRNDPQLTQLTNDPAQDVGFVWSPDGSQIAFQRLDGDKLSIFIMNEDGSDPREIASGSGKLNLIWSMNGKSIYASSTENNWIECEGCVQKPGIYRIDLAEPVVHQVYSGPESQDVFWYLYDTPQNVLYFMRIDPAPFLELWGTWFRADGNSIQQIDPLDPHQTCRTTTGDILDEHISPNKRYSVISNSCAGGFDLYLADREADKPQLIHLLTLPSDTQGQGGDLASVSIRWSPDGRQIVYDNGMLTYYLLNLEQTIQEPYTQPVPLIELEKLGIDTLIDLAWQPQP
jgi:Tol biopolymer transport system component